MPNKPFKVLERDVAALIGGWRLPANSGHAIDAEGPRFVAQCKLVKSLSLEQATQLVEAITAEGLKVGKLGIVGVKVRRGVGKESPIVVMMSGETFAKILGTLTP